MTDTIELTIYVSGLNDDGQTIAAIYDKLDVEVLATQERHGGNGTLELEIDIDPIVNLTSDQLDELRDQIESAGAHVKAFGPTPYINMAQIAEQIERTPQNILQLATGERGPGNFPTPINPGDRGSIWEMEDVGVWLETAGIDHSDRLTNVVSTLVIREFNDEIRAAERATRILERKRPRTE